MSDDRAQGPDGSLTSEGRRFDQYATDYANAINSDPAMRLTGEDFAYYLEKRLSLVEELLESVGGSQPPSILDFGCGAGETQVAMRGHFPQARLVGVDASAEAVRVARERALDKAEFHVSDGLRFPIADNSIDVAYSNGTFHHVEHSDHAAVAREIFRVVRPGGHIFMFENNGLNPVVVWAMGQAEVDRGARRVLYWNLRRTFARAGFRTRAVRFYAFFPKLLEPLRKRESLLAWLPLGAQYVVWGQKPE